MTVTMTRRMRFAATRPSDRRPVRPPGRRRPGAGACFATDAVAGHRPDGRTREPQGAARGGAGTCRARHRGRASRHAAALRHPRHRRRGHRGPGAPAGARADRAPRRPDPSSADRIDCRNRRHARCRLRAGNVGTARGAPDVILDVADLARKSFGDAAMGRWGASVRGLLRRRCWPGPGPAGSITSRGCAPVRCRTGRPGLA